MLYSGVATIANYNLGGIAIVDLEIMLPLDEIPIPMVSDLGVPADINVGARVCEHCNSNPENELAIKKELYETDIKKIGSSELVGKFKKRSYWSF